MNVFFFNFRGEHFWRAGSPPPFLFPSFFGHREFTLCTICCAVLCFCFALHESVLLLLCFCSAFAVLLFCLCFAFVLTLNGIVQTHTQTHTETERKREREIERDAEICAVHACVSSLPFPLKTSVTPRALRQSALPHQKAQKEEFHPLTQKVTEA